MRLSAPGDQVISTVPGGAYATWSGTSMAAPHVSGVAALLRAHQPGLNAVDVAQRIITTAQPICAPAPDRLDAAAALGLGTRPYACSVTTIYLPLIATPMLCYVIATPMLCSTRNLHAIRKRGMDRCRLTGRHTKHPAPCFASAADVIAPARHMRCHTSLFLFSPFSKRL